MDRYKEGDVVIIVELEDEENGNWNTSIGDIGVITGVIWDGIYDYTVEFENHHTHFYKNEIERFCEIHDPNPVYHDKKEKYICLFCND